MGSGMLGGAVSGASAGSAFGPWGAVIGGGIGAVAGGMSDQAQKNQQGAANDAGNTQAQYAQQAAAANQQYLSQGLNYLNSNYGNAQNALGSSLTSSLNSFAPYTLGANNALDLYETSLGIGVPVGGNFNLMQSMQNNVQYQNALNAYNSAKDSIGGDQSKLAADIQNYINQRWNPSYAHVAGNIGDPSRLNFNPNDINSVISNAQAALSDIAQAKTNVGLGADANYANAFSQYGGSIQSELDALQAAQKAIANGAPVNSLTPQQQQLVQAYQNGTLSQSGLLQKSDPSALYNLITSNPAYQFSQQQGQQAVLNQASARGLAGSAPMAKELLNYSQGLASQTFGDYQNKLANFAGLGAQYNPANLYQQTGASQANMFANQANAGAALYGQMGSNISNSLLAQGAALSNAQVNSANLGAAQASGNMGLLGALGGMAGGGGGGMNPSLFSGLGNLFGGSGGGSPVTDWSATGGQMPAFDMGSFGL